MFKNSPIYPMYKNLGFILRLIFICLLAFVMVYMFFPGALEQKFIRKDSAYSVDETVGRFKAIAYDEGFRILEDFDHRELAEAAGLDLLPTQVVLFGKPAMGTRVIQENRATALVLPLKVMIWEDEQHQVHMGYLSPVYLGSLFNIKHNKHDLEEMENYLDVLTDRATL